MQHPSCDGCADERYCDGCADVVLVRLSCAEYLRVHFMLSKFSHDQEKVRSEYDDQLRIALTLRTTIICVMYLLCARCDYESAQVARALDLVEYAIKEAHQMACDDQLRFMNGTAVLL